MDAARRFGDILDSLSRRLDVHPERAALRAELGRLSAEIRALAPDHPLVGGVAAALRMTDGAESAAAPLIRLAAEMVADHAEGSRDAGDSGWGRADLRDYLVGLGPARAADFLEALATAPQKVLR